MSQPSALGPQARERALEALASTASDPGAGELDVLVVGGGIVGTGTALDAVTRGPHHRPARAARPRPPAPARARSKLIHGGLRYLEMFDFGLVREALEERGLLLTRLAPHLVRPVPFLYPLHTRRERPYVGAGLPLYDAMAMARQVRHGRAQAQAPVPQAGRPDRARPADRRPARARSATTTARSTTPGWW